MENDESFCLQMKNIKKSFNGVTVLDNVNFNVQRGTVHALLGENGAGKSTLMNILYGIHKADEGEIYIKGQKVSINNPKMANELGVSMIHQELSNVPQMKVYENIYLGREPVYKLMGTIKRKQLRKDTLDLLKRINVTIKPDVKLVSLSVAEAQMVEIAKAISYNADIIVMDEPTSAITEKEVVKLFEVINSLKKSGKAIIYISHKLDEIFKIVDYVTVLRDGTTIGTKPISELDEKKLISMMVGRDLNDIFPKERADIGDVCLEVKNFTQGEKFKNINFNLHKGEILGISGLMGAGRTELVESIFGLSKKDKGELYVDGKKVEIKCPKDAINNGFALVSEDRKTCGLNLKSSIKDNMTLANLGKFCVGGGILQKPKENKAVDELMKKLNIKAHSRNQLAKFLSGGNQQKIVIAKWVLCEPKIFILDEPTRGIDIGAKAEVYRLMGQLVASGKAVIMISSELPEVIGMSDRIIVMHEGEITGMLDRSEFDQEKIMLCATGTKKGEIVQ